jgi:hypothetical protein
MNQVLFLKHINFSRPDIFEFQTFFPFTDNMSEFEHLVDQVLAIDGSKSRSDILADLQYTKSLETTVNRIFDGEVKNKDLFNWKHEFDRCIFFLRSFLKVQNAILPHQL